MGRYFEEYPKNWQAIAEYMFANWDYDRDGISPSDFAAALFYEFDISPNG